ncbi:phage tail tape measure protein [Desulfovibrio desulfuricans]|uniref:phage tail tape measure protein n=1 Tax=Desulfovibrio desulfuricans TaxID=876 RepID=UPI00398432AF
MADKQVKVEISAQDRASQVLRGLGREADTLKGRLAGLRTSFGSLSAGLGAGTLGAVGGGLAFSSAISSAADFETALYETTKVSQRSTEDIKKQMLALPTTLGSVTELTTGYYQVLSAGISDVGASQETLVTSSKLAKTASVSQAEAIQALTKMMAGYRGELKSTAQAADLLMDIEEYGQASVRELVPIIGDLAGVSQIAAVSYKEMAASMSLLTQTAGSPAQAGTQYRALIMELLKPNEQMAKMLEALGEKSGVELIRKNGFMGALSLIEQGASKSGQQISKFIGSVEALTAFSALAANGFKGFADILVQVGSKANRTDESFEKWLETFRGVESQAIATSKNLMAVFGDGFLPVIKDGLTEFSAYLKDNQARIAGWGQDTANAVTGVVKTVGGMVDFCQAIPIDGLEYGILGAFLFGKKGAVFGLLATAVDTLYTTASGFDNVIAGKMQFSTLMNARNSAELKRLNKEAEDTYAANDKKQSSLPLILPPTGNNPQGTKAPALASSHGQPNSQPETGPGPQLPSLPAGFKPIGDGKKNNLAGRQFTWDTGLEQLRQEVANMEATINPASLGLDRIRQKLELEKQNAIAAAEAHAKLSVQRKEASPAEAQEKQGLEVKKAELTYAQKLAEAEEKGRQVRLDFYREFAELSGNYEAGIDAQTEAIRRQGEEFQNAGISAELVQQYEALKKLQTARDPMSGLQRGLMKFGSEYGNLAQQVESATTTMGNTIAGTISNAFMTGKASAADFFNSVLQMAANAASNYFVGQLFSGIGSLFGGGSTLQTTNATSSWADFGVTPGQSMSIPGFHSGGMVGVDTPTFTRTVPAAAFAGAPRLHTGGGWFGPGEYAAILKKRELVLNEQETQAYLADRSSGASVVNMYGAGNQAAPVTPVTNNIQIVPPDGYTASESRSNNGGGGENIRITFSKMMAAEAASYGSPLNNALRRQGMKTPVVRQG